MLSLCGGMTSCGDDDDEPKPDDLVTDTIKVKYDVETSSDLRKYCDVTASYTDGKGEIVIAEITKDDTQFEFTVDRSQARRTYTVTLVASPKKDFPAYTDSQNYTVSWDVEVDMERYNSKGNKIGEVEDNNRQTLTVAGSSLMQCLSKISMTPISAHVTYNGDN